MDNDTDVAVVGAGPTGLMLAGDLARAGVSCVVLERRTGRSPLTRAFAVHARTLEQLDARGAADELVGRGIPVSEISLFGGPALGLSRLPSRFPFVLVAPQYETEEVLEERARRLGADIRYGTEVTGFTSDEDGVVLQVREGEGATRAIRASWLVGADGMHSVVRETLGLPFPGKAVLRSVMLADVRLAQPPPDVVSVNTAGHQFCFIAPYGDGWYRVIAWDRDNQPPDSAPVSLDEVRGLMRQVFGTDFGMGDARWLSRFHSEERQVPAYRVGRVLLAGDAAHVHSPAGGLGMNTSIQDAANLGWKLAATVSGWAPDGLLDSYNAERHPVGRQVLRQSGAILRLGISGPSFLVSARKLLAGTVVKVPRVTQLMARTVSGIAISYPAPRGAHPLAGQRAADQPLADGRRLYEALGDGQFVITADGPLPPEAIRGYGDRVTAVTAVTVVATAAATGTLTLVRPDAYVAWAADASAGTGEIRDALARWCGAPA